MRTLWLSLGLLVLLVSSATADLVTGKVVGPDGKPVAGALVVIRSLTTSGLTETTTSPAGEFSADLPPAKVSPDVRGRATIYSPNYALAGGLLKPGETVFRLVPGEQLRGSVTDESGKPVAHAHVCLGYILPSERNRGSAISVAGSIKDKLCAESGADGRFVIGNVPAIGRALVRLEDPRFASASAQIPLGVGATAPPLVAIPGAVIIGRVVLQGGPAKAIGVFCQSSDDTYGVGPGGGAAETAEDGTYRISSLPAGTYNVMADDRSGRWVAVAVQDLKVGKGETVQARDLVLTAGAMVEGTVTDAATGQPLPDVSIGGYGPHRPRSTAAVSGTSTDAAGNFRLRVAPGESYVYIMRVPEGYLRTDAGTTVTLALGETKQVPFQVSKGLSITGLVVDEKGAPAPAAQLHMTGPENTPNDGVSLDPQGRFTLSALAPGAHTIYGAGDWKIISPMEVTLPTSGDLRIVVRKLTLIPLTGRVVTPTGLPVEGVKIQLMVITPLEEGPRSPGVGEPQDLATDAQGRFSLPEVRPDATIQVTATKEGYTFVSGGEIDKQPDVFYISDLIFTPLASTLQGVVVDDHGKPVAGARVMSPEAAPGPWGVADGEGRFTLSGVASGEVHVLAAQGSSFGQGRAVVPGPTVTVRLDGMKPAAENDVLRGFALLSEVWRKSQGTDYYARENLPGEIAPYDPDLALRLVQGTQGEAHDYALVGIVFSLAETDPARALAWGAPRLAQMSDPTMRSIALGTLGLAVAESNPEEARKLYQQLKELLGPSASAKTDQPSLMSRSFLVALAGRLKEPEAEAMLTDLITVTKEEVAKQGSRDRGLLDAVVEGVAKGSPAFADQALAAASATGSRLVRLQSRAIESLALYDPKAALRLFSKMAPPPEGPEGTDSHYYDVAAKVIISAIGPTDPAAALEIARKVTTPASRYLALTTAATFQPKDRAAAIFREAQAAAKEVGQMARVAAFASISDPELGRELFAHARKIAGDGPGYSTEFAFFYSQVDPAESRLMMESEFARRKQESGSTGDYWTFVKPILALAATDADRAIELANSLGNANAAFDAQRKIAQYLLAPTSVRRTLAFDRWGASDTWRPGTPTGW